MNNFVDEKIKLVRDFINHPWKQRLLISDKVKWDKLCSSMDVIEDTQVAINYYFQLENFDARKGGYLYLYGLLQAFFIQQDALNHLSQALFNTMIDFKTEYPDLYSIRELRNDAIGHPTSRNKDKSFHYISRISICKESFALVSSFPKIPKSESKEIQIADLQKQQERSVINMLDEVIDLLNAELLDHKEKFKNSKIRDLVPDGFSYSISKIYEGVYSNYPLAQMNFDSVKETFEEIKNRIDERYGSYEELSGVKVVVDKINYVLQRLESWFNSKGIYENNDAEIFVDALNDRFKELFKMIDEIDEEFR